MLGGNRSATSGLLRVIAAPLIALRVPPNAVTIVGLLLVAVPCYFAAKQQYLIAGITLLVACGFDALDGTVARATNRVTPFGGFLDSVLDRVADGAILIAIGSGSPGGTTWWIVIGAGLVGQYLTSYTRARSYQDADPPPETWRQVFERPERVIFLGLLLIATDLAIRVRPEAEVLLWGLAIYAAMTLFTSLIRVLKVRAVLQQTHK